MSLSLSFRLYRLKTILFFWLYRRVQRLYIFMDTHALRTYRLSDKFFAKETLNIAKQLAESQCVDSGRCAVKNWKPSPDISQKAEELAWKAKQETNEVDLKTYEQSMAKIQSVRELTSEENAKILANIASINKLEEFGTPVDHSDGSV